MELIDNTFKEQFESIYTYQKDRFEEIEKRLMDKNDQKP